MDWGRDRPWSVWVGKVTAIHAGGSEGDMSPNKDVRSEDMATYLRTKRLLTGGLVAGLLVALVSVLYWTGFVVIEDWEFICRNTASQKGYREWFFGLKTHEWDDLSALDSFIGASYPSELRYRWVPVERAPWGILGDRLPNRVILDAGPMIRARGGGFSHYVRSLSPVERKRLYDVLCSGAPPAYEQQIERFVDYKIAETRKLQTEHPAPAAGVPR